MVISSKDLPLLPPGLWAYFRQIPQAGTQPGGKDHCFHACKGINYFCRVKKKDVTFYEAGFRQKKK